MDDYISRQAAIDACYDGCADCRDDCADNIRNLPPADVRPVVRGRWISKEYMYGDPDIGTEDMWVDRLAEPSDYYAYCSDCNGYAGYNGDGALILSDFCPNCGAIMNEGGSE